LELFFAFFLGYNNYIGLNRYVKKSTIRAYPCGLFHTPMTDYQLNTVEAKEDVAKNIPLQFTGS